MKVTAVHTIEKISAGLLAGGIEPEAPVTAPNGSLVLRFVLTTDHGTIGAVFFAEDDDPVVRCMAVLPMNAPIDRCDAVARVIMKVNFVLAAGAFLVDFDSGRIRFWTMMPVSDDDDVPAIALTDTCVESINQFGAAILDACFGRTSED